FTESAIANNLADPTAMEIAPDGRIFVTEQGGRLRVIENGVLRSQPFLNQNGGAVHFGTDGKLYIAVGENANPPNSQTLGNLLGKILRINPNGSIPSDNPFFNTASGVNRAIWALGL